MFAYIEVLIGMIKLFSMSRSCWNVEQEFRRCKTKYNYCHSGLFVKSPRVPL